MTTIPSQEDLRQMASRWLPASHGAHRFQIHTDTSDFFRVEYGDVVVLNAHPYLIRHNAREGRFGIDDDVKFWVKRAIDLKNGAQRSSNWSFTKSLRAISAASRSSAFAAQEKKLAFWTWSPAIKISCMAMQ
jgi:hypothetical protein